MIYLNYVIMCLGGPRSYFGLDAHFEQDFRVALSKRLLLNITIQDEAMLNENFKCVPYRMNKTYHAPDENCEVMTE